MEVKHIYLQKIGEFTFEFVDKAGNKGTATAKVNWIGEDFKFNLKEYKTDGKYILGIKAGVKLLKKEGTTVEKFKENIDTNQNLVLIDKDGKTLNDKDIIGTGTILKVGDRLEYTIIVSGDIDGNGMLSTNDLSKIKMHYIKMKILEGNELKAADIDESGKITTNDLSKLKLALIGNAEIN
ncbi:MAG: hypothetical protein HFJ54_03850 [Clostridia bacterium]|nr:hypothetical protein [Clostridia bacterium]